MNKLSWKHCSSLVTSKDWSEWPPETGAQRPVIGAPPGLPVDMTALIRHVCVRDLPGFSSYVCTFYTRVAIWVSWCTICSMDSKVRRLPRLAAEGASSFPSFSANGGWRRHREQMPCSLSRFAVW